jgi:hypothetical protein
VNARHAGPLAARSPRRSIPGLRSLVCCGLAAALLSTAAAASERREEAGPRLNLPGGHVVHPGESIRLCWGEADGITEMEILLSVDGGRHYSVCISPQLDPVRREFIWRVPDDAPGALRMRIRFNRNGHEIEGAPTTPLVVATADGQPAPLGLPAAGDVPGAPRPTGRGDPADRAATGSPKAEVDEALPKQASPVALVSFAPARFDAAQDRILFAPPRAIPLRT